MKAAEIPPEHELPKPEIHVSEHTQLAYKSVNKGKLTPTVWAWVTVEENGREVTFLAKIKGWVKGKLPLILERVKHGDEDKGTDDEDDNATISGELTFMAAAKGKLTAIKMKIQNESKGPGEVDKQENATAVEFMAAIKGTITLIKKKLKHGDEDSAQRDEEELTLMDSIQAKLMLIKERAKTGENVKVKRWIKGQVTLIKEKFKNGDQDKTAKKGGDKKGNPTTQDELTFMSALRGWLTGTLTHKEIVDHADERGLLDESDDEDAIGVTTGVDNCEASNGTLPHRTPSVGRHMAYGLVRDNERHLSATYSDWA